MTVRLLALALCITLLLAQEVTAQGPNRCQAASLSGPGASVPVLLGAASRARRDGHWQQAEAWVDRAVLQARTDGDTKLEIAAWIERGSLLAERGERGAAGEAFAHAERLGRSSGETLFELRATANRLRSQDSDTPEANAVIERAEQLPSSAGRAELLLHLAQTLASTENPESRTQAARVFQLAEGSAAELGLGRLQSLALGYRGTLYENSARHAEALVLTRQAIFRAAAADAPDSLYRWQAQLGRLQRSLGDFAGALSASRQAVDTLKRLREETAYGFGGSEASFREAIEPVFTDLVDLLLTKASRTEDPLERKALLREATATIEGINVAELRDYFRDECLEAHPERTADQIPGAVIVYPFLLPDRLSLIVRRGDGIRLHTVQVARESVNLEVEAFRRYAEKRTTNQYRPRSEQLYDWLVRPLEADAKPGDVLVFAPTGALRTIPLGALRDRETGTFLIERFPVAVIPALSLTDPRPLERDNVRILTAAITEAVQGYPPLPNVAQEIQALQQSFIGRSLVNQDFQAELLELAIATAPYDIVHIASHAEFNPIPDESFLLTFDGKLTLPALTSLMARTRFRERSVELLTLSACNTAAGNHRAALGLAGVAVRSGARSALGTLWSVNDQSTALLIREFYAALAKGESRARALQQAQIALLRKPLYKHPAFWSPFLMINSWL